MWQGEGGFAENVELGTGVGLGDEVWGGKAVCNEGGL